MWNKFVEYIQVSIAALAIGLAAITGCVFVLLCTPWPWLALIIWWVTQC